jgi:hypothetical protein
MAHRLREKRKKYRDARAYVPTSMASCCISSLCDEMRVWRKDWNNKWLTISTDLIWATEEEE